MTWIVVPTYPRYSVNAKGEVRGQRGRVLKGCPDKDGYLIGGFQRPGMTRKTVKFHRLVAEAFLGEIPAGMHVNHKNGIKGDNRIDNLEIVTPSQNTKHGFDVLGRKPTPKMHVGTANPNARFNENDVRRIRASVAAGVSQKAIAEQEGVTPTCICSMVARKSWRHVT